MSNRREHLAADLDAYDFTLGGFHLVPEQAIQL